MSKTCPCVTQIRKDHSLEGLASWALTVAKSITSFKEREFLLVEWFNNGSKWCATPVEHMTALKSAFNEIPPKRR